MDIGFWRVGLKQAVFIGSQADVTKGAVRMSLRKKGLCFFALSFLIGTRSLVSPLKTMPSFDAHAFGMLFALAMATVVLVISVSAVPVVRVVRVRCTPTRARRR